MQLVGPETEEKKILGSYIININRPTPADWKHKTVKRISKQISIINFLITRYSFSHMKGALAGYPGVE